jgi:hypothetical protein
MTLTGIHGHRYNSVLEAVRPVAKVAWPFIVFPAGAVAAVMLLMRVVIWPMEDAANTSAFMVGCLSKTSGGLADNGSVIFCRKAYAKYTYLTSHNWSLP